MNRIRRFFARTPEGAQTRKRALPYLGVSAFVLLVLLAVPPAWEYTNSVSFCGETCHTMPPEYQTYLVSPHARVPCVDCHIGRSLLITQAIRKTGHMRLLWDTITNNYHYPIRVSSMRPARDTCELCHFPEKFSDDSLRERQHFLENEENTPYSIYLLMHTGGGSAREGLGQGIHWHVENKVEYIARDPLDQNIPWVRVTENSGELVVYQTADWTPGAEDSGEYVIEEMDCITCHNRISHYVQTPRQIIDSALSRGDISTDIPNIRYMAESVLSGDYESHEEAAEAFDGLLAYYEETYPVFFQDNHAIVENTLNVLNQQWQENNFLIQELTWETHPNNIGHRDWPGCFRCHDGNHINAEEETIRLECNLCHSIPQVVKPTDIEPVLPLSTGLEPDSHLDSDWISRHHNAFDRSCANCHTVENPGGTSNTSFCSNSACHGTGWEYAGFDAPSLALEMGLVQEQPELVLLYEPIEGPLTYQTFRPLLEAECGACHGSNPTSGLQVTDYAALMAGGLGGPVIEAGSPENSRLFGVIEGDHFGRMSAHHLDLLRQWVSEGAVEGEALAVAPVSYETLQPVFEANCGECHGPENPERALNVTAYAALIAGSRGGPVIEPGDPDNSLILEVLNEGHFGQLSDSDMRLLIDWITIGTPETADEAAAAAELAAARAVRPTYQNFQPIFEERCGECHGVDDPRADLTLTTYDGLMAGSRYGSIVEPGSPRDSYILELLQEGHNAQLTTDQTRMLRQWIEEGAPEE